MSDLRDDNFYSRFGLDRPVKARARNAVRDFLNTVSRGEGIFHVPLYPLMLDSLGDDAPAAMREALDLDDRVQRLIAAWSLLVYSSSKAVLISRSTFERAERVVVEAVADDDEDLCQFACMLLNQDGVLDGVREVLTECMSKENRAAVFASLALLRRDVQDVAALRKATAAMQGDDEEAATLAAVGLLRVEIGQERAVRVVQQNLRALDDEWQFGVLIQLKYLGTKAGALFDVVREILEDDAAAWPLREQAAACLGNIAQHLDFAEPVLLKAMKTRDPVIILGAVEGLAAMKRFPEEGLQLLLGLLTNESEPVRAAAAKCLWQWSQKTEITVPALLERLGDESNLDVVAFVVQSLVMIGEPAIKPLVGIIQRGDARRAELAMQALAEMGQAAAEQLAQLLAATENERVSTMAAIILARMGKAAAPAVPALAKLLNETTIEQLAWHVVMCLFLCGPTAAPAIPALIECVAKRGATEDEIGARAEQALVELREEAIPFIKKALETSDAAAKEHLTHTLRLLEQPANQKYRYLEELQRDDLITMFIAVGDVLAEGEPLSWKKMPAILKERLRNGKIAWSAFPMGERSLSLGVKELGRLLKSKLTTHGGNKPQGGVLTDKGRSVLLDARAYMQDKSRAGREVQD